MDYTSAGHLYPAILKCKREFVDPLVKMSAYLAFEAICQNPSAENSSQPKTVLYEFAWNDKNIQIEKLLYIVHLSVIPGHCYNRNFSNAAEDSLSQFHTSSSFPTNFKFLSDLKFIHQT